MIEELLVINVVVLLVLGGVTISVSIVVLRRARGYVELAERRMESLREGQARLARAMSQGRQSLGEDTGRDQPSRDEEERRVQARREIELKIEQLQRQLSELREAQENLEVREKAYAASHEGTLAGGLQDQIYMETVPEEEQGHSGRPRDTEPAGVRESGSPDNPPEKVRLARWHLHPDDDAKPSGKPDQSQNPPAQMFREHYDRYLENYEGYVKLVERLCSGIEQRDGEREEQDREGRLRRLNDGIERTTSRLDILEQYNPELATDDRISRRADIARAYAALEKRIRTSASR